MAGCSSLERSGDLANHQLAANQSTKKDVVNSIGLPRNTEKSADGEVEFWYYTGKPVSTSYFVPVPFAATAVGPETMMVQYGDLGKKNVVGNDPVVLTCVFNRSGQLVNFYKPDQKQ